MTAGERAYVEDRLGDVVLGVEALLKLGANVHATTFMGETARCPITHLLERPAAFARTPSTDVCACVHGHACTHGTARHACTHAHTQDAGSGLADDPESHHGGTRGLTDGRA